MVEAGARRAESNKQLIDMLRRSRLFRDYEGVFTKATGLPLVLRPLEFWQLAHHGKKHENPFCALLAENPATLSVCLQAHQDMIDHTGLIPHTVTCPFGLTETAVPVKLGVNVIGYLRIGQVLAAFTGKVRRNQGQVARWSDAGFRSKAKFARHGREILSFRPISTMPLCGCSYFFLSNSQVWRINWSLNRKTSSHRSCKRRVSTSTGTRWNRLSLDAVAKAAGASVFHFCKVFHKVTGLKFTDYVARVRLEDARTQLLNPNQRISEVAYDVGFQSLTQFNRLFKRVFGQSPTEFRQDLATGKRSTKAA